MASQNCLWERVSAGPSLGPQPGTPFAAAATTPDVVLQGETAHLYVGAVSDSTERLVYLAVPADELTSGQPVSRQTSATVVLAPGPNPFDAAHVFDPAVLPLGDQTYLYYSAIGLGEDSIGGAISTGGVHFSKCSGPLLVGRAPEAVYHDGLVYLFYVLPSPRGGYAIHAATSSDGIHFSPVSSDPVLTAGRDGEWDGYEVTTPRIFSVDGFFYMLYAGGGDLQQPDLPRAFGLARSEDLVNWEKYRHNPVFRCGDPGQWDDGAIWFPTVFTWRQALYLIYEGAAAADLGGPGPVRSQVGLARVSSEVFRTAVRAW